MFPWRSSSISSQSGPTFQSTSPIRALTHITKHLLGDIIVIAMAAAFCAIAMDPPPFIAGLSIAPTGCAKSLPCPTAFLHAIAFADYSLPSSPKLSNAASKTGSPTLIR